MAADASWQTVLELLDQQTLGVLGTNHRGHAYTSLVAFAAAEEGRVLYFATTRATRKYHNLSADQQVALLIDSRSNQPRDFHDAAAVTAYGRAIEVSPTEFDDVRALYLARHPQLKSFVMAPTTALVRISVETYHLVVRFQHVTEFQVTGCPT